MDSLEEAIFALREQGGNKSTQRCPCGYATDTERDCMCGPAQIHRYRSRLSGPLLDRIDMHIEVMPVKFGSLSGRNAGVGSEAILERVAEARERQAIRFAGCRATRCNAEMDNRMVDRFCQLDQNGRRLMKAAVKKFGLSARAYHRLLKVARTITDLAGEPDLTMDAVSEAIQYRSLDREAWRV